VPAKKSVANQRFGKAARGAREQAGYSQEAFARHAGMDRANYGAIERGEFNVSLDTIAKIASSLGMRVSQLFERAKL
jgi:transcriptional regulator with XRE-family HTH domain